MLQGQGGDELFWGYPWVKQALIQSLQKDSSARQESKRVPELSGSGVAAKSLPCRAYRNGHAHSVVSFRRGKTFNFIAPVRRTRMVFYDYFPDFREAARDASRIVCPTILPQRFRTTGHMNYSPFRHRGRESISS